MQTYQNAKVSWSFSLRCLFSNCSTGAQRWSQKHRRAVLDNQRSENTPFKSHCNFGNKVTCQDISDKFSKIFFFFFNFAEIKLEMKPPGKLKKINTCLQYIQYNFVSDRSQTNIKYYSVKLSSGKQYQC